MRQRNVGIGRHCGDATSECAFSRWVALVCNAPKGQGTLIHSTGASTVRVGHSTRALLARCAARVGPLGVAAALLVALLHISLVASAEVAAQRSPKKGDIVRVTDDQMHQLGVMKVELYPFRVQKLAIGQMFVDGVGHGGVRKKHSRARATYQSANHLPARQPETHC